MTADPDLERLLRRVAECPPVCLTAPRRGDADGVHVDAVVHDVLVRLGEAPPPAALAPFGPRGEEKVQRLALLAAWLLADPWFAGRDLAAPAREWLLEELPPLAGPLAPERIVADGDRREEFVRLVLQGLALRPQGETAAQAEDRLAALDSAGRAGLMRALRGKLARARELRRKMAEDAAREAAARAGREW